MNIGDKVRILNKSIGCDLGRSSVYENGKGIGYILRFNKLQGYYIVGDRKNDIDGDWFVETDLELYDIHLPEELFEL